MVWHYCRCVREGILVYSRISAVDLSFSPRSLVRYDCRPGPFIYNDNDKRNDNSRLYAGWPRRTDITCDVVFMKRGKNSKGEPINRPKRFNRDACNPCSVSCVFVRLNRPAFLPRISCSLNSSRRSFAGIFVKRKGNSSERKYPIASFDAISDQDRRWFLSRGISRYWISKLLRDWYRAQYFCCQYLKLFYGNVTRYDICSVE